MLFNELLPKVFYSLRGDKSNLMNVSVIVVKNLGLTNNSTQLKFNCLVSV